MDRIIIARVLLFYTLKVYLCVCTHACAWAYACVCAYVQEWEVNLHTFSTSVKWTRLVPFSLHFTSGISQFTLRVRQAGPWSQVSIRLSREKSCIFLQWNSGCLHCVDSFLISTCFRIVSVISSNYIMTHFDKFPITVYDCLLACYLHSPMSHLW